MVDHLLPSGKLPPALLTQLLAQAPVADPDVLLGPGLGLDCAVVTVGERLLVFKSDPITFATDEMGWYLVQVNANDIATTGARPRWLLVTLFLPQAATTPALVKQINAQIGDACRDLDIALVGGHTEVTAGLNRPLAAGTLVGEVLPERLVTPRGASAGDRLLLTKGVPIEGVAILAREFPEHLRSHLSSEEIARAAHYLYDPGISIVRDAQIATGAGRVTAMHDPTEGGLASALWELAEASQLSLVIEPGRVPVPSLARRVCQALQLDPLATIASGALLLAVAAEDGEIICESLQAAGIECAHIGRVEAGTVGVWQEGEGERRPLPWPERDEIARAYDEIGSL